MIRPVTSADYPALKALWRVCFGDEDAWIDAFLAAFGQYGVCAEADGRIAAAAYALPMGEAVYIYGVAALPALRGHGLGQAVTEAAAAGRPAYLCPASVSLRRWYEERMGAVPAAPMPCRMLPAGEQVPLSAEEYSEAREALLRDVPHVRYPLPMLRFFASAENGGRFFRADEHICAAEGDEPREVLPGESGGTYILGLNNAPPCYFGMALD